MIIITPLPNIDDGGLEGNR